MINAKSILFQFHSKVSFPLEDMCEVRRDRQNGTEHNPPELDIKICHVVLGMWPTPSAFLGYDFWSLTAFQFIGIGFPN